MGVTVVWQHFHRNEANMALGIFYYSLGLNIWNTNFAWSKISPTHEHSLINSMHHKNEKSLNCDLDGYSMAMTMTEAIYGYGYRDGCRDGDGNGQCNNFK